jgi:LAO/AO transport system kinase
MWASVGSILAASYCPAMIAPVAEAIPVTTLAQRLLAGDRRALARAISLVEDDRPEGWELVREVYPHTGRAAVYGFTGPPGVGKSTLISALTRSRREAGRTVGVLSIDPSSPFSQGALLGDRIRLGEHFLDPGVFIRSMANRGALGGLSEAALQAALLLDAAGREDVFVETVGVGQAEVDIIDHADTIVLVLMPGSGDSIQALKAGVMEIPDVIVINKADHPLTDTMVREIRGVLSLANLDPPTPDKRWRVPIVKTEAAHGHGIPELVRSLDQHREHILAEGQLAQRRGRNLRNEVLALATARLRRRLEGDLREDPEFQRLLEEVVQRRLDPASAAAMLLDGGGELPDGLHGRNRSSSAGT